MLEKSLTQELPGLVYLPYPISIHTSDSATGLEILELTVMEFSHDKMRLKIRHFANLVGSVGPTSREVTKAVEQNLKALSGEDYYRVENNRPLQVAHSGGT